MKKVEKKKAIQFFKDNYIMISSLERSEENGCTEKILNILKQHEKCVNKEADIKINVTSAEIIVHGTVDKPYYEIKYFEIGGSEYHIGYGSYNLNNVFKWLKECFEIVNTDG